MPCTTEALSYAGLDKKYLNKICEIYLIVWLASLLLITSNVSDVSSRCTVLTSQLTEKDSKYSANWIVDGFLTDWPELNSTISLSYSNINQMELI
jgi:hypothetical protein